MEKDFHNLLKLSSAVMEAQADYYGGNKKRLAECKRLEAQLRALIKSLRARYPESIQAELIQI